MMKRIVKYILIIWAVPIGLLLLLVALLYVPPVQRAAVRAACAAVSDSAMQVSVGDFRMRFPLIFDVKDVCVLTSGDTLCAVQALHLEVEALPLFRLVAVVPEISAQKTTVHYTDSTGFCFDVLLDEAEIHPVEADLGAEAVAIGDISLSGGAVAMRLGVSAPDTVAVPDTTSVSLAWRIAVRRLAAETIAFGMEGAYDEMTLSAGAGQITVAGTAVDLSRQTIDIDSLLLLAGGVAILTDTAVVVPEVPEPIGETHLLPWTARVGHARIDDSDVVYGQMRHMPQPGFDAAYIELSQLSVALDSVYNRASDVAARLRTLSCVERSGLAVRSGSACFSMDSAAVLLDNLHLTTDNSYLTADLRADGSILSLDGAAALSLSLDLMAGLRDAVLFMPSLDTMLSALPFDTVSAVMEADGTLDNMQLQQLYARLPSVADFDFIGQLRSLTATDSLAAHIDLTAHLDRLGFLPVWAGLDGMLAVPDSMLLTASLDLLNKQNACARLSLTALDGLMSLDARYVFPDTAYRVENNWRAFPVGAFLPQKDLGLLSMGLSVDGRGLDLFSPQMRAESVFYIDTLDYGGYRFRDLGVEAMLDAGEARARILAADSAARIDLQATGRISPEEYTAHLTGEVDWLDLKSTRFADDSITISTEVDVEVWAAADNQYTLRAHFGNMALRLFDMHNTFDHISLSADLLRDSLDARAAMPGVQLAFSSREGLDTLLDRVSALSDTVSYMVDDLTLRPGVLCDLLPDFALSGRLVPEQVMKKMLWRNGLSLDTLLLTAGKSVEVPLSLMAETSGLSFTSFATDSLTLSLHCEGDSIRYAVTMKNIPATSELLAEAGVSGFVGENRLFAALRQKNQEAVEGLALDIDAHLADTMVRIILGPESPTLGTPAWQLNDENFIDYYFDGRLAADVRLEHDIQSFALRADLHHASDSVALDIANLRVGPILQTLPGMPPLSTLLSASLLADLSDRYPVARGTVRLDSTYYEHRRVGDLALTLDYQQPSATILQVEAGLTVDSLSALSMQARYDIDTLSTRPLDAMVDIPAFPLAVTNAFLPEDMAQLQGVLRGAVSASGRVDAPRIDGRLIIEEGVASVPMLGADFRFAPAVVSVADNRVHIDTFHIFGANKEPLRIQGTVDLDDFTRPRVDASVKAHNFEIFDTPKNRKTMAYGTAMADIDLTARGFVDALSLRGNVELLNGTDATYVLRENSSLPGVSDYGDMVTFTSFADTTDEEIAAAPFRPVSGMDMLVNVDIGNAVALSVELTPDGNSRIDLQGGGSLTYSMNDLGDSRFTGRYELSGGVVCYTPPLIGQKLFDIKEGSSVVWEGDIAAPVLDITAVDKLSVAVSSGGDASRQVLFHVSIAITGTLESLSIVFDVSAPGDMTIQNELTSLTAEQRASQAMSLLIYNMYTGPGSSSQGDMFSGNPLNQFLQNELNKWSRNNLKGVDLSFGIDSRNEADGSTHTDYSYQISKKLFNDRVRIVVGGSYSPDDNSPEALKQNLVDDIALEYRLDKRDNMVLKIFRHTGQPTILEGEVTETGVGFAVRKKLMRLAELFRLSSRKKSSQPSTSPQP